MQNGINQTQFILSILRPFKFLLLGLVMVSVAWAIHITLQPYLLKILIDKVTDLSVSLEVSQLSAPVFLYLLSSLWITIVWRFCDFLWLKFSSNFRSDVGYLLMQRMMNHSLNTVHDYFSGNLANKISDVMTDLTELIRIIILQFLAHILGFTIAIYSISYVSAKFSLLLGSWIVIYILVTLFFSIKGNKLSQFAAEVRSEIVGRIVDIFSNINVIHLFSGFSQESKNLRKHLNKRVIADQKRDWWFLFMFLFQGCSFIIYQGICLMFLVSGFKDGAITSGDFVFILSINITIIECLWPLSMELQKSAEYFGNVTQGLEIALSPHTILDIENASELKVDGGEIKFENVKFHYKGAEPLFNNKSITISPGEKVGLVGYSGGGKTTFANLILRLHDINDGKITIDGQDISLVTQESLRKNIAMIPQDPSLFCRSVFENIAYGKESATVEEVIFAAKKAHAHEFIEILENGYNSEIGEKGLKLSGGQRQRVAIARAILKNAPILIIDEATSQLDSVTEGYIQDSLWSLMQNKTAVVIAHRLSTLLHMDRILVFSKGEIVEDGKHTTLLSQKGLYKTLWDSQIGGFLPEEK